MSLNSDRTKTIITSISPIKGTPHIETHTTPSPSLPPNKSRRYTNPFFFSPITSSLIITSGISKSPQVRFLIVWSSLNWFTVHQPATTDSVHLQSTSISHLQYLQSEAHLESSRTSAVELFWGNSQCVKTIGCFCRKSPSVMFDRILNATRPNN